MYSFYQLYHMEIVIGIYNGLDQYPLDPTC